MTLRSQRGRRYFHHWMPQSGLSAGSPVQLKTEFYQRSHGFGPGRVAVKKKKKREF